MLKSKQIWVSPDEEGWRAHKPGAGRSLKNSGTQQEAIEEAIKVALSQGGEVIIQRRNGKIREKNSYPPPIDRCPPNG